MKSLKILLCHNYYQQAGGESLVFENQIKGLKDHGHSVITYCEDNNDIFKYSLINKIKMIFAGYYSQKTFRKVRLLVEREIPDIAIVQNVFPLISPSLYLTLHSVKIPIIQSVYNYRFICPAGELYTKGKICERCLSGDFSHAVIHRCYRESTLQSSWYASIIGLHYYLKTIQNCVDVLMVPDDFLKRKLVQGGYKEKRIQVNPNPFFVSDFEPSDHHIGYFVYVGRLVHQKGIFTLLTAMKHSKSTVRLRIVGQGESQDKLIFKINELGLNDRVEFLGAKWGEEALKIIRDSIAVVIPSEWYDNLPLILCQANACGKPVIASRINGIPEYVNEGVNGFLFTPGNSIELAQVMNRIASFNESDYADLSQSSRNYANRELDYKIHYQKLSQIIFSLLEKK